MPPRPTQRPLTSAVAFAARPPSTAWESVPLADSPQHSVWVWCKPQGLPDGLIATIPDETFATYPHRDQLTMRRLMSALGIDPAVVAVWYLYGAPFESLGGANPLLDQCIPNPPAGGDPRIVIRIAPAQAASPATTWEWPAASAPMAPSPGASADAQQLLSRIDADWNAILQLEANLALLRKQLAATLSRVESLNRDLTPDERLHGDRQDKNDWQVARRWLRDVAARLSRYIKEYDMGVTSAAGKREWFEQTYEQLIAPRRPFDGIEQVHVEFESHRKLVQTLLNNMNAAQAAAIQDGERRAQDVLKKIAAKVRTARTGR